MTTTSDHAAAPVRASTAEREQTIMRLHHALGEGRLDLTEAETRVVAAHAAIHRADLAPLLADLPTEQDLTGQAPPWRSIWISLVWRTRATLLGPAWSSRPPSARECRRAVVLVLLAGTWTLLCAFLGAMLVFA